MTTETFQSSTIPSNRLLPGIHGLRGIAALAVVLFHLHHLAKINTPELFSFIAKDFGYGVHLFFVLSAFSLMYSTEHTMHRTSWVTHYFIKRFSRIAPLFYFVILIMSLAPVIMTGHWTVTIEKLLLNLTFTFSLVPWKGIVWAGWTVGVEMIFYLILPVLLLTSRTIKTTTILLIISIIISYLIRSTLHEHYSHTVSEYGYNWSYFSFGSNICFFIMGIFAFRLIDYIPSNSKVINLYIPGLAILLIGMLLLTNIDIHFKGTGRIDLIFWGLAFTFLCTWQSIKPVRIIANKFFEYAGERSFSIYLLHPMIIVLLREQIVSTYTFLKIYVASYAFFICGAVIIAVILLPCQK